MAIAHVASPNKNRSAADDPGVSPTKTRERFGPLALVWLTAALLALCIVLAVPFLPALSWGVSLAIIALPMHRWIAARMNQPALAAGISSFIVVALIVMPGLFVVYQLFQEAGAAAARMQIGTADGTLVEKLSDVPALNGTAAWMERLNVDLEAETRKMVYSLVPDLSKLAGGSIAAAIQLLAAVFILFYLFRDRGTLMNGLRELLPMTRVESDRVFERAADSVHANVYAAVVTSFIDALGGGIMFWLLGLPSPLLWAVVMFVLALVPVVGAAMVWLPMTLFLALTDRGMAALALAGWGITTFILVDNLLYIRLAGNRMRMHPVPSLIAFLGGLVVFGFSGMILGPAILAVTVAMLEVWKRRVTGDAAPPVLADSKTG